MVVGRMIDEVGVVAFDFIAEREFAEESVFDEEGEGAIDGGSGDGGFDRASHEQEVFGGEVFFGGGSDLDDGFALGSAAEAAVEDELG